MICKTSILGSANRAQSGTIADCPTANRTLRHEASTLSARVFQCGVSAGRKKDVVQIFNHRSGCEIDK